MQARHVSPKTLAEHCIENIAQNMDKLWTADFQEKYKNQKVLYVIGPFSDLDCLSLSNIITVLKGGSLLRKIHLQVLVTRNLSDLDLSDAAHCATNSSIVTVTERCERLKRINLSGANRISSHNLVRLIQTFGQSLESLILDSTKMNDSVAFIIGSSCTKLYFLSMCNCKAVTDDGFTSIFKDVFADSLRAVAKTLKVLHFVCTPGINKPEVLIKKLLLSWSPQLCCVNHGSFWESAMDVCLQTRYSHVFHIVGIQYQLPVWLDDFRGRVDFGKLFGCFPVFKNLTVALSNSLLGMELVNILKTCGNNLSTLTLDWTLPYSYILYIGKFCPNICKFQLDVSNSCVLSDPDNVVKSAFERYQNKHIVSSWKKLESFHLFFNNDQVLDSAVPVLKEVFRDSCNSLKQLVLCDFKHPYINEMMLFCLQSGYFMTLESLDLQSNYFLEPETIWEFVVTENNVGFINLSNCNYITYADFQRMSEYIQAHKLNLKIEYI